MGFSQYQTSFLNCKSFAAGQLSLDRVRELTRGSILEDLETLYHEALAQRKLAIAVRIKELQGKDLGLFKSKPLPFPLRIQDLTRHELESLLRSLPPPGQPESKGEICSFCGNHASISTSTTPLV